MPDAFTTTDNFGVNKKVEADAKEREPQEPESGAEDEDGTPS